MREIYGRGKCGDRLSTGFPEGASPSTSTLGNLVPPTTGYEREVCGVASRPDISR